MIYKLKKFVRWLAEFGFAGVWHLVTCGSPSAEHVRIRSKRFGPLICRNCIEDFEAVNTVMCFDAYRIAGGANGFASVLDLGANIGIATRYFLTELPGVPILAVEPSRQNCELLRKNLAEANAANVVTVWEAAIGPTAGVGHIQADDARFDSFRIKYNEDSNAGCETGSEAEFVAIRPLDEAVADLQGPILVKMDVEGAEGALLACRSKWIHKVGRMMIEFHDGREESHWLAVLASEGWTSEKHFDTWHFFRAGSGF